MLTIENDTGTNYEGLMMINTNIQTHLFFENELEQTYEKKASKKEVEVPEVIAESATISNYLRQIGQYKVLTIEEEQALFKEYKKTHDKNTWTKIYNHNLRLVTHVAKKYFKSTRTMDEMDIIMEGNFGLMEAIERFDPEQGYKFSTYATWWIKQNITRKIANYDNVIRIPVHVYEDIRLIKKHMRQYEQENGGTAPSIKWLSEISGLAESRIEIAMKNMQCTQCVASLDSPVKVDGDESGEMGDFVKDESIAEIYEEAERFELRRTIDEILSECTQREQDVIRRRFGFTPVGKVETLEEIGQDLGVTRERIRQIEAKVLKKMRSPKNMAKLRGFLESYD